MTAQNCYPKGRRFEFCQPHQNSEYLRDTRKFICSIQESLSVFDC